MDDFLAAFLGAMAAYTSVWVMAAVYRAGQKNAKRKEES